MCIAWATLGNETALDDWLHIYQKLIEDIGPTDPTYLQHIDETMVVTNPKSECVMGVVGETANMTVSRDMENRTTMVL